MTIYHGFVRSFLRLLLMSENREPQSPLGTRSNAFNHIPTPTWGDSSCTVGEKAVGEKAEVGDAENFVSHRRVASERGFPFRNIGLANAVPRSHHWQSFGTPEATVLDYNTSRTIYRLKLGIETWGSRPPKTACALFQHNCARKTHMVRGSSATPPKKYINICIDPNTTWTIRIPERSRKSSAVQLLKSIPAFTIAGIIETSLRFGQPKHPPQHGWKCPWIDSRLPDFFHGMFFLLPLLYLQMQNQACKNSQTVTKTCILSIDISCNVHITNHIIYISYHICIYIMWKPNS